MAKTFWIMWTGLLVNRMGAIVVSFLAIYLTTEKGFSPARAGLVIAVYGAGRAIGATTGGILSDRWGRRPTMLLGQFGQVAATLGLGLARGWCAIVVCAFAVGFLANTAVPAFSAMVVDTVPQADRVRAYSLNHWAYNLGMVAAAAGGGLIARAKFSLIFLVDAGATLVTALITMFLLRETGTAAGPAPASRVRVLLRDRAFLAIMLLTFGVLLVIFQYMSTLPIGMTHDGYGPATYGWVIAVNSLLIVGGQLFVPRLVRGLPITRLLAAATALVGLGFGLGAVAHSAWFYAATVAIWTFGELLFIAPAEAAIGALAPDQMRGLYLATFQLSFDAAATLAPIAGGLVQEHFGDATLWMGCAALCLFLVLGQLASSSYGRPSAPSSAS